jgi:putative ABC transport system substrate-binding protein
MRRIGLAVVLALSLTLAPVATGQQAGKVPRLGIISGLTREAHAPFADALRDGLQSLGYVEGRNIVVEWQYADGRLERFAEIAAELVRVKVDLIVAENNPSVVAALTATKTTPIVMVLGIDPVDLGFVTSLARPGGTITGFSSQISELVGKRLQLFQETVPNLSRVAVLWDPTYPGMEKLLRGTEVAARALGLSLQAIEAPRPNDIEPAFATMTRRGATAVVVLGGAMQYVHRTRIADLARKQRLSSVCALREYVAAGCLMSYAPSFIDLWRHSATYVAKILKGATPENLPVQQPTKFEFVINLKTAKALGLTIPQSLLLRADEIIQ